MLPTRLETATKFLNTFATLDTQTLSSLLSESYTHAFGPSSITVPGPFNKAGFVNHMDTLKHLMTGFPVYINEIIESEASNAVWAWCTSQAQFRKELKDDQTDWGFKGEYVFMFWMDGDGTIGRCVEILDSKATVEGLVGLMERATASLEKMKAEGQSSDICGK